MLSKLSLASLKTWTFQDYFLLWTGCLIAFITLFPKVPIADAIPGYIVRIRLEDVLMGLTTLVWGVQVVRGKIQWRTPLTIPFGIYIGVGALSLISAVVFLGTIPFEGIHLGKSLLHFFRYIEYFCLFLIAFTSIKSKKDVQILVMSLVFTFAVVGVYGLGQKYEFGRADNAKWPVYSTMNREFSKGIALQLHQDGRVQSTFGGHYDIAAYSIILGQLLLAFLLTAKTKKSRLALTALFTLATWLVVASASRISFGGYLVGMYIVMLLLMWKHEGSWKSKLFWGFKQATWVSLLVLIMFAAFGKVLAERYSHFLAEYPQITETYHQINGNRKNFMYNTIPSFFGFENVEDPEPTTTPSPRNPITPSDRQPAPADYNPAAETPSVVVEFVNDDGETETMIIESTLDWSENAIKYGLSLGIRFDTLWPNAVKGFQRNPLLGSGYATLNKEGPSHNTEADSTDNNYLRTLGETGLLGFTAFYGTILMALLSCWHWLTRPRFKLELTDILAVSLIGASFGLAVNALLIDVFASSKVAFTFWAFTGIVLAGIAVAKKEQTAETK